MEGHMSKKTKEPPKSGPQGEHQVPKPPPIAKKYQIRKGEDLLKGCLA